MLALAALAYAKPWERLNTPTIHNGTTVPWMTPYSAPTNSSDAGLAAISAEARKSPTGAALLAGFYQVFADMIESETRGEVIVSAADVRRACEMGSRLMPGGKVPFPAALFNAGGNVGLIDQYVKRQCGDSPAQLTPETRAKFVRAYRDVAWALEQES